MSDLVHKKKAIKPTSVMLPSKQRKPGDPVTYAGVARVDPQARDAGVEYIRYLEHPLGHPSPLMRRLGYTRNPATCGHYRKKFITSWTCMDCGMSL